MATPDQIGKALAVVKQQTPEQAKEEVSKLLDVIMPNFAKTLPKQMDSNRFMQIFHNNVLKNPKIAQCSPTSIIMAVLTAAQVGLEPDGKLACLIPYENKFTGKLELQFQEMYQGIVDLICRDGFADFINAYEVRDKDVFELDYGNTTHPVTHKPCLLPDKGEVMGYYAIVKLKARPGEIAAVMAYYMSRTDIIEHAKQHSKGYNKKTKMFSGVWLENEPPMCKKTVLLQLAKFIPKSPNLTKALDQDETSRSYVKGFENVIDIPTNTDWQDAEHEIQPEKVVETPKAEAKAEVTPEATKAPETGTKAHENGTVAPFESNLTDLLNDKVTSWPEIRAYVDTIADNPTKGSDKKASSPRTTYGMDDGNLNKFTVNKWGGNHYEDEAKTEVKPMDKVILKGVVKNTYGYTAKEIVKA
jgi:recombination protein RecT